MLYQAEPLPDVCSGRKEELLAPLAGIAEILTNYSTPCNLLVLLPDCDPLQVGSSSIPVELRIGPPIVSVVGNRADRYDRFSLHCHS